MKQKSLLVVLCAALIFATNIFLTNLEKINAQECRIVRVTGGETDVQFSIYLEPERVTIAKGGCVIVRDNKILTVYK